MVSISVMAQSRNFNREELQPVAQIRTLQNKIDPKEDILRLKMDYFKNHLTLNEEHAIKFWLLFDDYLKAERKIHEETKKLLEEKEIRKEKGKVDFSKLTDEQIYFYYENHFKKKERLAENEQKFYRQIKEFLFAQEIAEYYRVEKEFKKEISQEVQKKTDVAK